MFYTIPCIEGNLAKAGILQIKKAITSCRTPVITIDQSSNFFHLSFDNWCILPVFVSTRANGLRSGLAKSLPGRSWGIRLLLQSNVWPAELYQVTKGPLASSIMSSHLYSCLSTASRGPIARHCWAFHPVRHLFKLSLVFRADTCAELDQVLAWRLLWFEIAFTFGRHSTFFANDSGMRVPMGDSRR